MKYAYHWLTEITPLREPRGPVFPSAYSDHLTSTILTYLPDRSTSPETSQSEFHILKMSNLSLLYPFLYLLSSLSFILNFEIIVIQ